MTKHLMGIYLVLPLAYGCTIMEEEPHGVLVLLNQTSDRCLRFAEPLAPGEADEVMVRAGQFELPIDLGDVVDAACDFTGRERFVCSFAIEPEGRGELRVTDDTDMPPGCRPNP